MEDKITPLLLRVAAQDRAAFKELYALTSAKLFGVLMRILGNRAECEDVLQEVYTRIWLRAAKFDPAKGTALSWSMALTRNLAIDRLRARPKESSDETALASAPDLRQGVEASLAAKDEAKRIVDCLATLEPEKAKAVQGAYLGGLSYQQLADRFDVPLNTMRTWLRRSLISLRECLGS